MTNIRRWAVALLCLVSAQIIKAQVGDYRNELAVGVNGGLMMSSVSFVPKVPQKQMQGISGGLTFRYTCEKYFNSICAVVAEVNYAQAGWSEDILDIDDQPCHYQDAPDEALFYKRRINYIQVPILARLGWGRERRGFQAFFQVGPQVGFMLSESTDTNLREGYEPENRRASYVVAQESMPVENKFDYGIAVGAGLEFSHPKTGHFLLEGRYYYGLGNLYGSTKSDYFARSNFGQIVIKASYLFDIVRTKNDKIK